MNALRVRTQDCLFVTTSYQRDGDGNSNNNDNEINGSKKNDVSKKMTLPSSCPLITIAMAVTVMQVKIIILLINKYKCKSITIKMNCSVAFNWYVLYFIP